MKETSKTPNRDALIDYIKNLTPAQVNKVVKHMPLLKQLPTMSENELVFVETFAAEAFGGQKSA